MLLQLLEFVDTIEGTQFFAYRVVGCAFYFITKCQESFDALESDFDSGFVGVAQQPDVVPNKSILLYKVAKW